MSKRNSSAVARLKQDYIRLKKVVLVAQLTANSLHQP